MRRRFFLICLIAALVVFTCLFLKDVSQTMAHVQQHDKLAHFAVFFCIGFIARQALKTKSWILVIAITLYGGLIEILQSYTGYRQGSWDDLLADFAGVLSFFVLWGIYVWQKNGRLSAKAQ